MFIYLHMTNMAILKKQLVVAQRPQASPCPTVTLAAAGSPASKSRRWRTREEKVVPPEGSPKQFGTLVVTARMVLPTQECWPATSRRPRLGSLPRDASHILSFNQRPLS